MKKFESQQFRNELAKIIKQAPKKERRDILDRAREGVKLPGKKVAGGETLSFSERENKPVHNAEAPWDEMNPQKYLEANYTTILEPDREILETHLVFYKQNPPHGDFLEVGCGPNLYPILVVLPYVNSVTIIEFGKQNVDYLNQQLDNISSIWDVWIAELKEKDPEVYGNIDFRKLFKEKVKVIQGSIFDLPKDRFDAAAMHFVSESITQDLSEFNMANKKFAEAVKPGGIMVAAFMKRSEGYKTSGPDLPAVPIVESDIEQSFKDYMEPSFRVEQVKSAIPVREGDHGMIMLHGIRHLEEPNF